MLQSITYDLAELKNSRNEKHESVNSSDQVMKKREYGEKLDIEFMCSTSARRLAPYFACVRRDVLHDHLPGPLHY